MKYQSDVWFPPTNILYHGNRKLANQLSNNTDIKHMKEAMSVAIMLTGIIRITGLDFYIQIVDPREATPDIRTMTLVHKKGMPNEMLEQEVEVVTLEEHSSEEADAFIKRTKLNPRKHYPASTIILCHINKSVQRAKSIQELYENLKSCTQQNDVYVVGRVDPVKQIYRLAKIHPKLQLYEDFDVIAELTARPQPGVLKLHRGTEDKLIRTSEKTIPFA